MMRVRFLATRSCPFISRVVDHGRGMATRLFDVWVTKSHYSKQSSNIKET
jgi:hypothetical protein